MEADDRQALERLNEDPPVIAGDPEISTLFAIAIYSKCHTHYDVLGFPGGLEREIELLAKGDRNAIDCAIVFLEADPWFFRSGYTKQYLARRLKRIPLSESQAERLRQVVLSRIKGQTGREFRSDCHLARSLDSPDFRRGVQELRRSPERETAGKAAWVLAELDQGARDSVSRAP